MVPRTGLEPACLSTHAPETCASTNSATSPISIKALNYSHLLCPEQDSNLHASRHTHLKRARLPIPPPGQKVSNISKRAENETRTRDPNLGKVMLYQLSYFRICNRCFSIAVAKVGIFLISASIRDTFFSGKCAFCFCQTTNVLIINSFYCDNLHRKIA